MRDDLLPDVQIKINNASLPAAAAADLISVTVNEEVETPSMFTLQFYAWDQDRIAVTWADDSRFAEGSPVEISLGYVGSALKKLMVGEITGLELTFGAEQIPTLTVRGYSLAHRLLRDRKPRTFTNTEPSAIAREIAASLGLTPKVTSTQLSLAYQLQTNESALEFLQSLAESIGYEVVVEEKILHFRPYQNAASQVLTLTLDSDLTDFSARLSTMNQVSEVSVAGWDVKQKKTFAKKAAAGSERTKMGGSASGPQTANRAFGKTSAPAALELAVSEAQADKIAKGLFEKMALEHITGDGSCPGRPELRAGTVVKIDGLGKRFSGSYYVTSVTHTISAGSGYQTNFSVKRNAS